jgi:hypothetical protein
MAYEGNIAPVQVNEGLNNVHFDVKKALRITQSDINDLISEMADPNQSTITIDGRTINKTDTVTLQLALSNKMNNLQNQTTTILSVFTQMYQMEKSVGSSSGG